MTLPPSTYKTIFFAYFHQFSIYFYHFWDKFKYKSGRHWFVYLTERKGEEKTCNHLGSPYTVEICKRIYTKQQENTRQGKAREKKNIH